MIPLMIVEQTTDAVALLTVRDRRKVLRAAFKKIGETWQKKQLPRHFREGNRRRYNHKARTAAYKKQKRRLARRGKVERGGRVDLVYSGLLESLVTRHHIVKAFPTRATINLQGPRYVTMRPKDPTKPFKAREIITVRDDERADLDEVGAKELDKQTLKLKSKTKTKKIK